MACLDVLPQIFTLFYIQNNPTKFVETDWMDFRALREFLKAREVSYLWSVWTKDLEFLFRRP